MFSLITLLVFYIVISKVNTYYYKIWQNKKNGLKTFVGLNTTKTLVYGEKYTIRKTAMFFFNL